MFLLAHGVPIRRHEDIDNKMEVHGFIVEGNIPENPEDVHYPRPEFIAPLFIGEGNEHLYLTGSSSSKSGLAGYINAEFVEGRLMDLDHFKENFSVPEEAGFKLMEDAEPIYDIIE